MTLLRRYHLMGLTEIGVKFREMALAVSKRAISLELDCKELGGPGLLSLLAWLTRLPGRGHSQLQHSSWLVSVMGTVFLSPQLTPHVTHSFLNSFFFPYLPCCLGQFHN